MTTASGGIIRLLISQSGPPNAKIGFSTPFARYFRPCRPFSLHHPTPGLPMKNFNQNLRTPLCAALFILFAAWQPVMAATKTWDGGGAPDGNWSNGLNWDND